MNILIVSEYSQSDSESCLSQLVAQFVSEGNTVRFIGSKFSLVPEQPASAAPDITIYDTDIEGVIFDEACIFAPELRAAEVSVKYPDIPFVRVPGIRPVIIADIGVRTKKLVRADQVSKIVVTIANGKVFDGDEESQNRMNRAFTFSYPAETTLWTMADDTDQVVTREELWEAGRLAGIGQTTVWIV